MENNEQKPDNYLIWAVLSTVLCCLPLGIVALLYANKVDPAWYAGRYQEAQEAAKAAKMWSFIALGVGVVGYIILFFLSIIVNMLGS